MDTGALFIGGFMLFASGVVLASVFAALDMKRLRAEAVQWQSAYERRTEQLQATRIALRESQAGERAQDLTIRPAGALTKHS